MNTETQLQDGHTYETRDGDGKETMTPSGHAGYPWTNTDPHDHAYWAINGRLLCDGECSRDLVKDITPEVEPEPDKMTVRDRFAMAAMQAMMNDNTTASDQFVKDNSSDAYMMADAMMEARLK